MINKPILLKGKKYYDKRGFFQEIYLFRKYKVKVIFSAIAYSKKCNKRAPLSKTKQTNKNHSCD